MKAFLLFALSVLGSAAVSTASAAIVGITYSGTVISVTAPFGGGSTPDLRDDFGGGTLVGDPFTASFSFDTSQGQTSTFNGATIIQGGSGESAATPLISSTLTIDGMTVTPGGFNDYVFIQPGVAIGTVASDMSASGRFQDLSLDIDSSLTPASLTTPTAFTLSPSTTTEFFSDVGGGQDPEYIYLSPTSATLTLGVSAAPEPSGWLLMILGCGFIGSTLRRARRKGAPIAA